MNNWVRYYHDTPTDPKWRAIAKKSGQRIGDVLAVWSFVLTNASANATERGRTHNLVSEDIAASIDLEIDQVDAIIAAMEGKVLVDGRLLGWEKRNPIKDDGAAERSKRHRERNRTQPNGANALDRDTDKDTEKKEDTAPQAALPSKPQSSRSRPKKPEHPDFPAWYDAYPRHEARGEASAAFHGALESGATPEELLAGALRYDAHLESAGDRRFTKLPATWLNKQCWKDRYDERVSATNTRGFNNLVAGARAAAFGPESSGPDG